MSKKDLTKISVLANGTLFINLISFGPLEIMSYLFLLCWQKIVLNQLNMKIYITIDARRITSSVI